MGLQSTDKHHGSSHRRTMPSPEPLCAACCLELLWRRNRDGAQSWRRRNRESAPPVGRTTMKSQPGNMKRRANAMPDSTWRCSNMSKCRCKRTRYADPAQPAVQRASNLAVSTLSWPDVASSVFPLPLPPKHPDAQRCRAVTRGSSRSSHRRLAQMTWRPVIAEARGSRLGDDHWTARDLWDAQTEIGAKSFSARAVIATVPAGSWSGHRRACHRNEHERRSHSSS